MSELRIGTCSWKYDSWRGIVYPRAGKFDYLQEYSKQFDTVEVDRWFWSLFEKDRPVLPRTSDAREYAAAVPADFRFTVKAPTMSSARATTCRRSGRSRRNMASG